MYKGPKPKESQRGSLDTFNGQRRASPWKELMWPVVDSLSFVKNEIMRSYLVKKTNGGNMKPSLVQKTSSAKILFHQKKIRTHFLIWVSYWKKSSPRNKSHGSNSLWGLVWRSCWQSRGLFDIAFVWLEGSWSPTAASVGSVKAKIRFLTLLFEIRAPFSGKEHFYSQTQCKKASKS